MYRFATPAKCAATTARNRVSCAAQAVFVVCSLVLVSTDSHAEELESGCVLSAEIFRPHVDRFLQLDEERVVNQVSNAEAFDWMQRNIPYLDCPDEELEEIYYFRWWTFRKHIKHTEDGFVITEFLTPVGHAGTHNTISCALGHHLYEGRWLHDQGYLNDYIQFWLRGNHGGPQPHLHRYSNWIADAVFARSLVHPNDAFLVENLQSLVEDYRRWEQEKQCDDGLFWQYDVRDGMEESISGSRSAKNQRPTINSYMYANAQAIARIATIAGRRDLAAAYAAKATRLKYLVQERLWDAEACFFKVRLEDGSLSDAREQIGYIPWYFSLPDPGYESAWQQLTDPQGFFAPCGITTAEQRHPGFRTHGTGRSCEWDGAVWPFATSQTLVAMSNLLRNYRQSDVSRADYYEALQTYARSHHFGDNPYIGEYLDEQTGDWLKGESERSRHYNHSTFADLVITGLVGLQPQSDDVIEVDPLIPANRWDWFCLDHLLYHGRTCTIIWDKTGERYKKGPGLRLFADGEEIAVASQLQRLTVTLKPLHRSSP